MNKTFKFAVLGCTALSMVASQAAYADTVPAITAHGADADTVLAMSSQCNALAEAHEAGNEDHWSAVVVPGSATLLTGPTEDESTRVVDESTIVGTGTFVPGHTYIVGNPFRIGGSVNMFGDQYADSGHWPTSTYNFHADYASNWSYAFSCDIYQAVHHDGYTIPGHPVEGYYTNNGTNPSNNEGSCQGLSPNNESHWGTSFGNCTWHETGPATEDVDVPEKWDVATKVGNEPGVAVEQDQSDNLYAFEDLGGPVDAPGGVYHIGQTVICISPSTTVKKGVPGAWVAKNGYETVSPTKCTTDWFVNHATWGSGTESSNGTYISVPDYQLVAG